MEYEQSKWLSMFDAYIDSEDIYFSNNTFNALMRMNRKSGVCQYISSFQGDVPWAKMLHRRIIRFKDYLFFFPMQAKGVSRYHLLTGQLELFEGMECDFELVDVMKYGHFACLLFRSIEQDIYLFDMENCCFVNKRRWNESIKTQLDMDIIFFSRACIVKSSIWTYIPFKNFLIEIDLDLDECNVYQLDIDDGICSIVDDGQDIWLLLYNMQKIIKWNKGDGIQERYNLLDGQNERNELKVWQLFYANGYLLAVPNIGNKLFIVNMRENERKLILLQRHKVKDKLWENWVLSYQCPIYDNIFYFLPFSADKLYEMELDTYQITSREMVFRDMEFYYKNIVCIQRIWINELSYIIENEDNFLGEKYQNMLLSDLINIIKNNLVCGNNALQNKRAGYHIYKAIQE